MTAALSDVTKEIKPEPTAEETRVAELVVKAREQGRARVPAAGGCFAQVVQCGRVGPATLPGRPARGLPARVTRAG
jgi:hypothetical protein